MKERLIPVTLQNLWIPKCDLEMPTVNRVIGNNSSLQILCLEVLE